MIRNLRQRIVYDINKGYTTAEIAERRGVEYRYVSKIRGALTKNRKLGSPNGGAVERIKEQTFKTGFAAVAMFNGKRPRRVGFRFYKMDTRGVTPDGVAIYAAVQA